MVLKQNCEIKVEGDTQKRLDLPHKEEPLELAELPDPIPKPEEILVRVSACGVCHTEIDEIEGRQQVSLPIILGHEIVGRVERKGSDVTKFKLRDRVGIAWINSSCQKCSFCHSGRENLCPEFKGTGCDANGGYAQFTAVQEDFAYPIPERFDDFQAAPLLCAGAVGYRALKLTGIKDGETLGLFGFGASAHIVIQVARYKFPNTAVFVFTRNREHQEFARKFGAEWTGLPDDRPPKELDFAVDFTPVGATIPKAMAFLRSGGKLVVNAIRKRDPITLHYAEHLWHEKEVKSVANITRKDVREFLSLAAEIPIVPEVQKFELERANEALRLLKQGRIQGAGVLKI